MLQAFTLLNNTKLKSELITVHITFNHCACSSVPLDTDRFHFFYNKKPSIRQQRAPIDQIHTAWPPCRSRSLHDKSASSSTQPRSKIIERHIFPFGRLQVNPVSSTQIAT
jgi:hypothetical protein